MSIEDALQYSVLIMVINYQRIEKKKIEKFMTTVLHVGKIINNGWTMKRFFISLWNSNPKITLEFFCSNIVGVPSNPKTSFDYMEGIFSDVKDDEKNLSPSVLKKKIENLQSSGHHSSASKRWENFLFFKGKVVY